MTDVLKELEAFDAAAQEHGWACDQGSRQHEAEAKAAYEAAKATLIARIRAAEERTEKAREQALIDGWNACRKSIYAVCEDVDREAEDTYLKATSGGSSTSTEGHLSEFQSGHVSGYRSGMVRAAKSIARGFNAMEARDDDNLTAAIRAEGARHDP